MPVITMPDGTPVTFPDDMPKDQIQSMILKKFPDAAKGEEVGGGYGFYDIRKRAQRSAGPPVTTRGEAAKEMFTDIPSEVGREFKRDVGAVTNFADWWRARGHEPASFGGVWEGIKAAAGAAGGAAGLPFAPAIGAAKSLYGHGLQAADPTIPYEEGKEDVDVASMLAGPGRFRGGTPPGPPRFGRGEELPGPSNQFGISQPGGAIPKTLSEAGQKQVKEFKTRQLTESAAAKERIQAGFDVLGEPTARTPEGAGKAVSEDLRVREAQMRGEVRGAYKEAKAYGGKIQSGAFGHVPDAIKLDIEGDAAKAAGGPGEDDAIHLSEMTTPRAMEALPYLQRRIEQMTQPPTTQALSAREEAERLFGNKTPRLDKSNTTIGGISLENIDQLRKELGGFRTRAFEARPAGPGHNSATMDERAMQRVMQSFDDNITKLVNSKHFQGDPRAVKAWNWARAKHYDYKRMFSSQGKGTPSEVVANIINKRGIGPPIAGDVVDWIIGSDGVNPDTLNVAVTRTIKGIVGETSKTWSAIRAGLLDKIYNPKGYDPKQNMFPDAGGVKTRLLRFLGREGEPGHEMANLVYTLQERNMLRQFAEVHGKLDPERTGKMGGLLKKFSDIMSYRISAAVGGILGGVHGGVTGAMTGAAAGAGARKTGDILMGMREARTLSRNIPTTQQDLAKLETQLENWQQDVLRAKQHPTLGNRQKQLAATFDLGAVLRRFGINDLIQQPTAADRRNDRDRDKLSPKNVIYGGPHS